ncbi:hypothetical protein C8R48DRAFT_775450 [Suillus tomentosus]|nr:hypothetical protein C8R48DRAFT_775450 [Suillus tomentosus]
MQTFRYQSAIKAVEAGKSSRPRPAYMHDRLEASFAWAQAPLSTEPRDADDFFASPESILPDAEFAALEESKKTEEVLSVHEVLEGNAFDFNKLDRVEEGMIPQTILDEIEVINYNGEDDGSLAL